MKIYVAVDIGCIECGEDSAVIGLYLNEAAATGACGEAAYEHEKNWRGQHSFEVFAVDTIANTDDVRTPVSELIKAD